MVKVKAFDYEKACKEWKWKIPEFYNMGHDCCDRHADGPDKNKIALYWENEAGDERTYTFNDFRIMSNQFGNLLRELGMKKGDRFIIRLPNIPEFQTTFLGGVKIGAVPIAISAMFTAKEIAYRINDSGTKAIVTTEDGIQSIEEAMTTSPTLKHVIVVGGQDSNYLDYGKLMAQASSELELEKTRSDDMAFFCYTSGTTGSPKGAVHKHSWAMANDPGFKYWQGYQEGDVVAHTGNLNWIFPLGNGFLYAWRWGASVLLYDGRFDAKKWFSLLEKYNVTNLATVPTALRMMLTVPDAEKSYPLKNLRHIISAGEPLNPEVIILWKKRFGQEVHEGIGMTEVMVYLSNIDGMPLKYGSCGRPQPGHICSIVDQNGKVLGPNEPGNLAVHKSDPGLFTQYWNKPDKTAECFVGDWFLSGDTLFIDEDGYYWFQGRSDDLIKASGYRISPFEVESAVIEHPAVLECAAVQSPDEMRGGIVKAFIILSEGNEPTDELAKEIQNFVKKNHAPYMYPREIEFVASLPKTQSGKIKRKELRALEVERKGGT
ncbi:MAG: benzoate-CoA ligase family protein [Candidatus Thermoplasmatota archaeon]|nr:benzoate-CoA ligase family protein [Euryarchaeota archaeon]MBU4032044.1 benzoate-CoA ligase family protein [Candidatus Thermoplasmatota archaeon]MBU4144763.1 benzoate-CoA ligase family protein [Candidatus Thermoplasmatota archaeon]MBU4591014.1 benzoate-CoA ligase family protein [Candidatus Thermoplasmatota archaeon]